MSVTETSCDAGLQEAGIPGGVRGPTPRRRRRIGFLIAGLMGVMLAWVGVGERFGLTIVVGESMLPTYQDRNVVLIDRGAYRSTEPRRGDIVIVRREGELLMKRVVGLPGEEVELVAGKLWVDGREWEETYQILPGSLVIAKGRLGPGRYAVLGDNRSLPPSQMVHAVITRDQFVGRVVLP